MSKKQLESKFYVDDHQHLLEVIDISESKVFIRNWTIEYTVGWDKIVWTLCSSEYQKVGTEFLEVAKKLYV